MILYLKSSRASLVSVAILFIALVPVQAACPGCMQFGSGVHWGTTTSTALKEASGIAVSTKNPGVLYTHNDDGDDGRIFAFYTNGMLLARFNMNTTLSDVEDMAIGPGPTEGSSCLYVGDIGGSGQPLSVRSSVKIVRIIESEVPLAWTNNPLTLNYAFVQTFTLLYPDGSYNAETLMLDPVSNDLFLGTKGSDTRIYSVNLNSATNEQTLMMQHVATVPFASAAGGAISANGGRIVLRRGNHAEMWTRCGGEMVGDAFARPGQTVPVVGPPHEANGEAIAFTPNGSGFVTISDSTTQPPIYFFPALCSLYAPGTEILQQPQSRQVEASSASLLSVVAAGDTLTYQWRFNGSDILGATSSNLLLSPVYPSNAGAYTVFVSGAGGAVTSSPAVVTVRILPPVIVTQPHFTLAATGGTAQLSVVVQGTPPLTYLWSRNKRPVAGAASVLAITNAQRAHAGAYRVVVSNSVGKATSAVAQLKVLNPPIIVINPQPKSVATGGRVTFRARAKGTARLRYQWMFNGSIIPDAVKPQLVLKSVQPSNAGNYSVTVTNAVGVVASLPAELLVR